MSTPWTGENVPFRILTNLLESMDPVRFSNKVKLDKRRERVEKLFQVSFELLDLFSISLYLRFFFCGFQLFPSIDLAHPARSTNSQLVSFDAPLSSTGK
jgi:hypothetical protein